LNPSEHFPYSSQGLYVVGGGVVVVGGVVVGGTY